MFGSLRFKKLKKKIFKKKNIVKKKTFSLI